MLVIIQFISKLDVDVFRTAEFDALAEISGGAKILGISEEDPSFARELYQGFCNNDWPVVYATVPSVEVAEKMLRRSVLIRSILLPFAPHETTVTRLVERIVSDPPSQQDGFTDLHSWCGTPVFKYEVESIEKKMPKTDKDETIEQFKRLPHTGITRLDDPTARVFRVVLVHGRTDADLRFAFHGAVLGDSQRASLLDDFSLKTRRYIGTTTMPPELTFLMGNLARVRKGDLVMDPFAGTGATLISAAFFGASTMGMDMDGRVLRAGAIVGPQATQALNERVAARTKRRAKKGLPVDESSQPASFAENFTDYGLPKADVARLNFSVACKAFAPAVHRLKQRGFLDSIVTDPPYGIREQQRRVTGTVDDEELDLTRKAPWACGDIMLDLVGFAAVSLVVGGHLVYWHPTSRLTYNDGEIPAHPCMTLVANMEQALSIKIGRRLIVMKKTRECVDPAGDLQEMRQRLVEPANVRELIDDVSAGNDAYFAYRDKRESIRKARMEWRSKQGAEGSTEEVTTRRSKADIRRENMENRARNVAERERRQQENDARQQLQREEVKRARAEDGRSTE